jgi:hypothetical protein
MGFTITKLSNGCIEFDDGVNDPFTYLASYECRRGPSGQIYLSAPNGRIRKTLTADQVDSLVSTAGGTVNNPTASQLYTELSRNFFFESSGGGAAQLNLLWVTSTAGNLTTRESGLLGAVSDLAAADGYFLNVTYLLPGSISADYADQFDAVYIEFGINGSTLGAKLLNTTTSCVFGKNDVADDMDAYTGSAQTNTLQTQINLTDADNQIFNGLSLSDGNYTVRDDTSDGTSVSYYIIADLTATATSVAERVGSPTQSAIFYVKAGDASESGTFAGDRIFTIQEYANSQGKELAANIIYFALTNSIS